MIDAHAHINLDAFDEDRDEVVRRAFDSGVEAMIIPSIEPKAFDDVLALTENYEKIYCGIGVHPHNAQDVGESELALVSRLADKEKVVAVGEIGLDYYYDFAPKRVQQDAFTRQLEIAMEKKMPVIIHNRDSDEDMRRILRERAGENLSGVLHCFSGDEDMLAEAVELGFYISFTGNITFKKSKLPTLVEKVPIERLLLETDCPFMAPAPNRGKRNEPSFLKYTAKKIAEIKSISIEEVVSMTTKNAKNLFNIAVLLLFIISSPLILAQNEEYEEEYYEDEYYEEEPYYYDKFLGIGPILAFYTGVDTYYFEGDRDVDISYEGILSYGGAIQYSPLHYLVLEASYVYTKNTKIQELNDNLVGPTIYQFWEFSGKFIPNPSNPINYYGIIGIAALFERFDLDGPQESDSQQMNLSVGVGAAFNWETNIGLFAPQFEWRINFSLNRTKGNYIDSDRKDDPIIETDMSRFHSIPRFSIVYFPNFLFSQEQDD